MTQGALVRVPTQADLERIYYELAQRGAPSVGRKSPWPYKPHGPESTVALASAMLRYDPRLLPVLVQHILRNWQDLNPLELRRRLRDVRYPQALCVVLEFVGESTRDPELIAFVDYVKRGWTRVEPSERFFLDVEQPGSRGAARRLGRNLKAYARWGFIGTERPTIDSRTKRAVGRYDAKTRLAILDQLIDRHHSVSLREYLDAVDHSVSRQQAGIDLARHPRLRPTGHGRGARWQVHPRPRRPKK